MDSIYKIQSLEEFKKALKDVFHAYCNWCKLSQTFEGPRIIEAAKDDLMKLLVDSNFDANKMPELLVDKGWAQERIAIFVNLLNEKKTELLYASVRHQNSEYGETVTDLDWLLKLVLGTSELNAIRYPLLQLILSTNNNGVQKTIMYDINKDMLLKTIAALETLQNSDSS